MTSVGYRFDRFVLHVGDRRLRRDGAPVEISSRYLDALVLLLREAGQLVSKDRFLDEVWQGVPVTDEALTQCMRTLRRQLGDDAASPRFIETVPKHGYRFIAPVERLDHLSEDGPVRPPRAAWSQLVLLAAAGTVGGGLAGFMGGLVYGFAGAAQPLEPGMGTISVMLVLLCLCILVAVTGAAGVSLGIAAVGTLSDRWWRPTLGGAAGGLVVGALVKFLGVDAFNLLLGRSPGDITGGAEGLLLGGAVGFGAWLAMRRGSLSLRRSAAAGALVGAAAGLLTIALGGTLMAGSLDLLASSFPESRLRLDQIGLLVGEDGLGQVSRFVTGALEGGLFAACIVGAMVLAKRSGGAGSLFEPATRPLPG